MFRKIDVQRYKLMATDDIDMDSTNKSDPLQALYNQKLHYSGLKTSLETKVEENENKIKRIESELKEQTEPDDWLIERFFIDEDMKAEFKDKTFAEKHAIEIAKEILCRLESNEDLMTESVRLNRHSYHSLNGMGRLSEELEEAFNSLLRRVEGKKSVNWKDNISSPKISKRKEVENLFSLPTYVAIPLTPVANTSRALVSVHDITPYSINVRDMTPEKKTPLAERSFNLTKLSLTSSSHKSSKSPVAIVAANKRSTPSTGTENNLLNDTFTIEAERSGPSPARRDHWKSPNSNYRNSRQYNQYRGNGGGSGYKSRSPYQSNHYSNGYNRDSNYNSSRTKSYNNQTNGRQFGRSNQNRYYVPNNPPFRF